MNIDWSKAPEGATHYAEVASGRVCWYMVKSESEYAYAYAYQNEGFSCERWTESGGAPCHQPLIERPNKQEAWSGSGKPPIGIECEVRFSGVWSICKTLAYHQVSDTAVAVHFLDGSNSLFWCATFRPIKTAEQLAEEEIQAIRDEIRWQKPQLGPCPVAQLYNKGYRKQ